MSERPTVEEYEDWAQKNLNVTFDKWEKLLFERNAQDIHDAARNHPFFRDISSILAEAAREFQAVAGARLFPPSAVAPALEFKTKSFSSTVEKSFRQNVVRNRSFPAEPSGGWVVPPVWYTQVNDIVRGTIVCAYIDGLPWLAERLKGAAAERGLKLVFNTEQRDEGYYAFHLYATLEGVGLQVKLTDGIEVRPFNVSIEVQLTTQLQDALRDVTHFFYEERRLHGLLADWKWQHDKPQFRASYISHSLHLLDAIIVELRRGVMAARAIAASVVAESSAGTSSDASNETVPVSDVEDVRREPSTAEKTND